MGPFDDETERYLKEFRPRAIRALEVSPKARNILSRRLATAAAVTLLAGGLLWYAHRDATRLREAANVQPSDVNVATKSRYESTLALTRLALTDNAKFEAVLSEESRKVLPTVQGERSMLKVLAKD
jgi:hypothetical protein